MFKIYLAWACVFVTLVCGCQKKEDSTPSRNGVQRPPLTEEIKLETRNPVLLKLFPDGSLSQEGREALLSLMKWSDLFELLDYPERVKKIAIQYNEQITDKDLQFLAGFPNLEELFLKNSSNITDEGMSILNKLPRLKLLSVVGTQVTEAGLPLIAEQKNLENLYLGSPLNMVFTQPFEPPQREQTIVFSDHSLAILKTTNIKKLWITSPADISDEGLQHIAAMSNLEEVALISDDITRKGVDKLLPVLPGKIVSVNLSKSGPLSEDIKPEVIRINGTTVILIGLQTE